MINMRREAALALEEILSRGGYSSLTVKKRLRAMPESVGEAERRFFTSLVYTTLEHTISIDAIVGHYMKTPIAKLKPYVLSCLRLGLCQLRYMDGVPPHAAINETVKLVRSSPFRGLAGLVNAILRRAQKEALAIPVTKLVGIDAEKEPVRALSLTYDMPEWIVELWRRDYGQEQAERVLQRMQTKSRVCLRANTLKADLAYIKERLKARGAQQSSLMETAFYIEHMGDVSTWKEYQDGLIAVQDESSLLAVAALEVRPGHRVLDMCAAPGGKSTFMAQLMENEGCIISRDLHAHRRALIEENRERLGASCIQAQTMDSTRIRPEDAQAYDRVLLDAPCSGLGMLRAKPDIRFHHSPQDEKDLQALQRRLLMAAAEAVKPGGRLVYSTCTLCRAENQEQVQWFLKRYPEFVCKDLENDLQAIPECDRLWEKCLTLWPQDNGHDGFFVACLEKKK